MLLYYVYISFCSSCYIDVFKACEKKANRRTPLFPNRRLGLSICSPAHPVRHLERLPSLFAIVGFVLNRPGD